MEINEPALKEWKFTISSPKKAGGKDITFTMLREGVTEEITKTLPTLKD